MATVLSSWPPAGCWWPPALDGGEVRHKIEQPRRAGCSRSFAEASSCSPADGSSYNEVANTGHQPHVLAVAPDAPPRNFAWLVIVLAVVVAAAAVAGWVIPSLVRWSVTASAGAAVLT